MRWPLLTMWAFPGSIWPPAFKDRRSPLGPASEGRLRSHRFLEGPWHLQRKTWCTCQCTCISISLLGPDLSPEHWVALPAPHISAGLLGCDTSTKKMSASPPHSPSFQGALPPTQPHGLATSWPVHRAAVAWGHTSASRPLQASPPWPRSWQAAGLTPAAHAPPGPQEAQGLPACRSDPGTLLHKLFGKMGLGIPSS